MQTLIKIKKHSNGFAHWYRLSNGAVIIEFKGGK